MIKQQGMTLIELMISLILSLTVIAGISSLFFQMQQSNRLQRALSTMADDSSYIQEILQKEIRRTGGLRSRSDRNGTEELVFLSHNDVLASGLNFATAEYIKGDATSPANDAFIIRYQLLDTQDLSISAPSNGSSPCTQNILLSAGDNPAKQEHVVSVYFYLHNGILSCAAQRVVKDINNGISTDACAANCDVLHSTTDFTPGDDPIDLINNVEKIELRYGVDSDGDHAANYYTDAATVPALMWQSVISIRLTVVVKSTEDRLLKTIAPYVVEGVSFTPTDHRLYKVFTTTIALRNQI